MQLASSDASEQSVSPSHTHALGIQRPVQENCVGEQVRVVQFVSSLKSPQSLSPSHCQGPEMHSPLAHRKPGQWPGVVVLYAGT